jgi:hypothetical protein
MENQLSLGLGSEYWFICGACHLVAQRGKSPLYNTAVRERNDIKYILHTDSKPVNESGATQRPFECRHGLREVT